jgi:LysR family transcriptional regulator, pca operon transcriptional activator
MSPLLHRIRMQHVRSLLACAQHGNMRAAAEALAITQPAVTKIIQDLEDIVGQPLMVRERHGVRLTPAGERFVRHARTGLLSLEQALDSVAPARSTLVRLGVLPTLPTPWLHRLMAAWRTQQPEGRLRVVAGRNAQLLEQLRTGELDLVLGRLAEPDRMMNLRFEPLWAEPLVAALRPDHPLLHLPFAQWQALTVPVVLALPGTAIRQAADDFLAGIGAQLRGPVVETLQPDIGRTLAWHDHALWLTAASTIHDVAESLPLQALALPGAASEAIGVYVPLENEGSRPGATQSEHAAALADFVALVHSLPRP